MKFEGLKTNLPFFFLASFLPYRPQESSRAAHGQLLSPGARAVGEGKRRGEEEVLDQAGREFPKVNAPYPHTS
jgi:hypothetical protein